MTPNYNCVITGGGTITSGEICIWNDLKEDGGQLCLYHDERTKGVHAIGLSPYGKYLASGSDIGIVRVWEFLGQDLTENTSPFFEIYHQLCPVTALVFLTDDLLLSAGENGRIRAISIRERKQLIDLDAHSGSVCSMIPLGSKIVASMGVDGKLKIWDMDSLSCVFQSEDVLFPYNSLNLYPSLAFSQETGFLCCPSAGGELHCFNVHNSCSHESMPAHQGSFYAVLNIGHWFVTGGIDHTVKLWDPMEKKLLKEVELDTAFVKLCPIGKEKFAAICTDDDKTQSLRVFSAPDLKPLDAVTGLNLRSIAAIPFEVREHLKNIESDLRKNKLIEQARSRIMDPQQMDPFLKQLVEEGFWADAKLLQAECAKRHNKPLHELEFLLQLTSAIKISQDTIAVFHRLATLLEKLNEPKLAAQHYEKLSNFIEQLEVTHQRLTAHPLFGLDPEKAVRSDISALELALQEIEKYTVLGRVFCWRLIMPSREPRIFKTQALHSLDLWEQYIREQASSKNRNLQMDQESVDLFDGVKTTNINWLRISQIGLHCPSSCLDYAIQIDQKNGVAQGYGIFNPNKETGSTDDVGIKNVMLSQSLKAIYQQREAGDWLRLVHERMKKLDKQASFSRS